MHQDLFSMSKRAKTRVAMDYYKVVKKQSYEVGEELHVFNILSLICKGKR